jgi:hypothetical protein
MTQKGNYIDEGCQKIGHQWKTVVKLNPIFKIKIA